MVARRSFTVVVSCIGGLYTGYHRRLLSIQAQKIYFSSWQQNPKIKISCEDTCKTCCIDKFQRSVIPPIVENFNLHNTISTCKTLFETLNNQAFYDISIPKMTTFSCRMWENCLPEHVMLLAMLDIFKQCFSLTIPFQLLLMLFFSFHLKTMDAM